MGWKAFFQVPFTFWTQDILEKVHHRNAWCRRGEWFVDLSQFFRIFYRIFEDVCFLIVEIRIQNAWGMSSQMAKGDDILWMIRIFDFEWKVWIDGIVEFELTHFLCFEQGNPDKGFGDRSDVLDGLRSIGCLTCYICITNPIGIKCPRWMDDSCGKAIDLSHFMQLVELGGDAITGKVELLLSGLQSLLAGKEKYQTDEAKRRYSDHRFWWYKVRLKTVGMSSGCFLPLLKDIPRTDLSKWIYSTKSPKERPYRNAQRFRIKQLQALYLRR